MIVTKWYKTTQTVGKMVILLSASGTASVGWQLLNTDQKRWNVRVKEQTNIHKYIKQLETNVGYSPSA